jgi:formylglycine-generating enzyme required for sulfatase activity
MIRIDRSRVGALAAAAVLAAMLGTGPARTAMSPTAQAAGTSFQAPSHVPGGFRAKEGTPAEPYSHTGWAKEIVHEKTGIAMVFIPAGEFRMAVPEDANLNKPSIRTVLQRVEKPFYIGRYEVTQSQWLRVMGQDPGFFKGPTNPVEFVTWDDCQEFLGKAGNGLRLPTEVEWEYACRAGTETRYFFGDDPEGLLKYAWFQRNASGNPDDMIESGDINHPVSAKHPRRYPAGEDGKTHPVGEKLPNPWGLYDMYGNVSEWCNGHYYSKGNEAAMKDDPMGVLAANRHPTRGGSVYDSAGFCSSAARGGGIGQYRSTGLRAALSIDSTGVRIDSTL